MIRSTFEEIISTHGKLIYTNKGDSMMPLIKQDRDLLVISRKPKHRLKKYDVPLYKRDSGQYVLHRILKVRKNDYVILGDNCINKEYGITDDDILGVMTRYVHKGKEHTVNETGYRLYSHIWCDLAVIRIFFMRVKLKLKRLIKK